MSNVQVEEIQQVQLNKVNETCSDLKKCKGELEECSKLLTDIVESSSPQDVLTHNASVQELYTEAAGQRDEFIKWMKFYEVCKTSVSGITQAEKSWVSRLRNPKLATQWLGSMYVRLWR